MVQISARPKVTLSQTSRMFIDILYIAAVVIVRTINSRTKKYFFRDGTLANKGRRLREFTTRVKVRILVVSRLP